MAKLKAAQLKAKQEKQKQIELDLIKRRDEWNIAKNRVKILEAQQREQMMINKYKVCTAEELASQFNIVLSIDNKSML